MIKIQSVIVSMEYMYIHVPMYNVTNETLCVQLLENDEDIQDKT